MRSSRANASVPAVLCVGTDAALLLTRGLALIQGGYRIASVSDTDLAERILQGGGFELALICQSIPEKRRKHLIAELRRQSPGTKVLLFRSGAKLGGHINGNEAVVDGAFGTREFLDIVESLLRQESTTSQPPP